MSEALISASPLICLNTRDNVAVGRNLLQPGEALGDAPSPIEKIGRGHKIALVAIAAGAPLMKYGQTIGFASQDIPAGACAYPHPDRGRSGAATSVLRRCHPDRHGPRV